MSRPGMFDYSKSMPSKSGKPGKPGGNTTTAPGRGIPKLSIPSMAPIMAAREKAEQQRINKILNPDVSRRLRFVSLGDPPRPEPQRSDFEDKPSLDFSKSMGPDRQAERKYQNAHDAWEREQADES